MTAYIHQLPDWPHFSWDADALAKQLAAVRLLLPHALALLYGLSIVYASLQPFGEWIEPVAGTP